MPINSVHVHPPFSIRNCHFFNRKKPTGWQLGEVGIRMEVDEGVSGHGVIAKDPFCHFPAVLAVPHLEEPREKEQS
jgi:hypothetical protein